MYTWVEIKYHISMRSFLAKFVQGKASPNFILFVSLEKGGDLCDATGVIRLIQLIPHCFLDEKGVDQGVRCSVSGV